MSVVTTPRGFKLGKHDPVESPFGEFKSYFAASLGAAPSSAHWGGKVTVPWGMLANGPDSTVTLPGTPSGWGGAGDCVEAFKIHALLNANYDEDGPVEPDADSNDAVLQYCAAQGCTPAQLFADPTQYDNGEDMTNSLVGWSKATEYGCKLAFTSTVGIKNLDDIRNAIALGGGVGIGIQLPQSAEDQFPNEWTWQPSSPILGGHAIWLCGYTEDYVALVTWGALIQATWQFIQNTIDEGHVVILPQMVAAGKTPSGLLLAKWEADLKALG